MSKIIDILKAAGSAALSTIYPIKVVESIVSIVSVLADDKQDTDLTTVTGEQLKQRIETLPPELQAAILQKVLDIEALSMEQDLEIQKTLSDLDARGKTFRPIIALMMAIIAALNTIAYSALMYWLAWKAGKMPSNEELIIPNWANSWNSGIMVAANGIIIASSSTFISRSLPREWNTSKP